MRRDIVLFFVAYHVPLTCIYFGLVDKHFLRATDVK